MDFSGRRILVLASSAFVVLAAEPLFLLVDTAVVGHLGRDQLAALGAASYVVTVLALIGGALEYGTTARAGRHFGAGDRPAAVREGVYASWLALIVGAAGLVSGEMLAAPMSRVIAGGGGPVASHAAHWLHIALFGMPALLLVLAGNGWMRGVQETRTPVKIVLGANALSAVASPVLVYPLGLGLAGSAIANILAQWVAAAFCLRALSRQRPSARPDWRAIGSLLLSSRDLLLRSAAFEFAFVIAAALVGRMGAAQLAAHQVGIQLWEFLALLLDSFGIAAMALVPAALGSGDTIAATAVAWRVGKLGAIGGVCFAGLMAAGWMFIPALFSADHQVRHQVQLLWPWLVAMLPAAGVVFALDGVLLGAGDTTFVSTLTLTAVVVFVLMCVLGTRSGWGLGGVWAGLACFIGVRFVGMLLRTRGRRWLMTGVSL